MPTITFPAAFAFTIAFFNTAHNDTLVHEYDVDALAAQIEHLANVDGLLLDTMHPVEFWTIAEPYRW